MSIPSPTSRNRAVITGASSGIGEELAAGLARRGHSLIVVARRADRLRDLAARLEREHGVTVEVRACDLGDRQARTALATELTGQEISVLCNNAGFATYGDLATLDPQREREEVELNVNAVHELTLAVLPGMLERSEGAILITGSTAGNQPGPGNTTYAATKAFANTFAESLAGELRGSGVSCTLLAPGPVRTEFADVASLSKLDAALPGPMWVSAQRAAEAALAGLERRKRRVVPGAFAKAQTVSGQYTPRGIVGPVLRLVYGRLT